MNILILKEFPDYELLDSGKGMRLERFGKYLISKPDGQAIWSRSLDKSYWDKADAVYENKKWIIKKPMPKSWIINYRDIKINAHLSAFKHLGLFPEQAVMWSWFAEIIKKQEKKLRILNLFGYTGVASSVAAKYGAEVTHVDSSRPSVDWAYKNMISSGLSEKSIRWILDDVTKFVKREVKRGNKYDGIIMDPPVYGRGSSGEVWKLEKDLPNLLSNCRQILSDSPKFFIINAYAVSASAIMLENLMQDALKGLDGKIECGELVLQEKISKRLLSTGVFARWSK